MPEDNEIDESSDIASEDEYDEAENSKNDHDDNIMGDQSYLTEGEHEDGDGAAPVKKAKVDPKDPSRPRRKKARRACFACQRAHLTCGKSHEIFLNTGELQIATYTCICTRRVL
jgi:hypothetical protein